MSMWMSLARVSADAFEKLRKHPQLVGPIFFDEATSESVRADLGIGEDSTCGFDWRLANDAFEAMAEHTGEEVGDDPVAEDLGVTGELEFEVGYGPAFFINPTGVKKTTVKSMVLHLDDEVKSVVEGAAAAGDYLVGIIS